MTLLIPKTYTHAPATISGVVAWWDASDASTFTFSSGNVVQDWRSIVGSYTLTQATAAKRPTRSGTVNGKSSVVFNGTSHALSVASFDITAGGQKFSLWAVVSAASGNEQVIVEHSANYNLNSGAFLLLRTSSNQLSLGKRVVSPSQYSAFDNSTLVTTTPVAAVATHDGTLSVNETTAYVNGSSAGTRVINDNTNANNRNDTLFVGARENTSLHLNGQICELGFTTTVLTTDERLRLERYLIDKWGT